MIGDGGSGVAQIGREYGRLNGADTIGGIPLQESHSGACLCSGSKFQYHDAGALIVKTGMAHIEQDRHICLVLQPLRIGSHSSIHIHYCLHILIAYDVQH